MVVKCPLHPKYKAILKPRSKRPGCICQAIYERKQMRPNGAIGGAKLSNGSRP
jgi:hypothetical protein